MHVLQLCTTVGSKMMLKGSSLAAHQLHIPELCGPDAASTCTAAAAAALAAGAAAAQVIIPTYWQRLFRMPPAAAATLLQHDFHNSFASVLFFGQELRLFVFEALLFSSLHMTLGNAATSGFITLIVQQVVVWVRQHWGENNLARKTLVDRHFLI
jgi:hypothetical protein